MRVRRSARFAALATLFLLTAALAIAASRSNEEPPWALIEILDHHVSYQDISGDIVVYREIASPLTLIKIGTKETKVLDEVGPCDSSVIDGFRLEGDWLAVQLQCLDIGEVMFQSHVYNLKSGESFLLAPDPPIQELPYSWYTDINDGRVVWSQLADCNYGDIYLLDLETRDINKVTEDPGTGARLNLHLGPEWLAWDEYRLGDDQFFDVHGANLTTGETITVTHGDDIVGNMPLAGNDVIIWTETNASLQREIWSLDLVTRETIQIEASGDYPFAADLSGDLLVLSDQVGVPAAGATVRSAERASGIPDEPCDRTRAGPHAHNRLRVVDLVSNDDAFVYIIPEADSLYNARIDDMTAIWTEWTGQYPDDSQRVLAARRLDHQYYMPLVFR